MKKILFGMMLLAGAFISCSKDATDLQDAGGTGIDDENTPQPIMLSVASNAISATRGTGTVGGNSTTIDNKWSGQKLSIYAVRKGEIPSTMVNTGNETNWPFDTERVGNAGRVGIAPEGTAGSLTWDDNRGHLYYPRSGEFDFWGYYDDGASGGAKEQYNAAKKYYSVPFTINGSQDLLRGRAEKNGENAENAYSAQAARAGIHPKLFFEHLLTRLTFKVKRENNNANDKGAAEVYVREVRVKSLNKGNLIFIYSNNKYADRKEAIDWATTTGIFKLQERAGDDNRTLQALNKESNKKLEETYNLYSAANQGKYDTKAKLKAAVEKDGLTLSDVLGRYNSIDGNAVPVGEALLVAPAAEYYIEIDVAQYYDCDENQTLIPKATSTYTYKKTIKADEVQGKNLTEFEASSSYNVTITVHGLQQIAVSAELEKWTSGGDITWDPDTEE